MSALCAVCCVALCPLQDVMPLFLFLGYSYWLPQIIHSAHSDTRDGLSTWYFVAVTVTRLFIPLYFLGYPLSFLQYLQPTTPQYGFCVALLGWTAFQVAVIAGQRKFGPRFFVPPQFLPTKYNYYRPVIAVGARIEDDPQPSAEASARARMGASAASQSGNCWLALGRVYDSAVIALRRRSARAVSSSNAAGFARVRTTDDDDSDATGSVNGDVELAGVPHSPSAPGRRQIVGSSNTTPQLQPQHVEITIADGPDGDRVLGAIDCVICMTEVAVATRDYMVTPCNHLFHEECLQQWMNVKLECPTCRAALPPP